MSTADTPAPLPQQEGEWARIKALFLDAIDIAEEHREVWLDEKCAGDAALRREVASLLASDREAALLFETPAAALPGGFGAFARRHAPGTRLGEYEIRGLIGAGGMGEVYRARDVRDGRDVAIKTVNAALAHPAGELRLLHEARHASTLTHANICPILEIGDAAGVPFIVMELVEGRTLAELQGDAPLAIEPAVRYAIAIADALEHAHATGLIHRDLKRSNVVIARDDRPVVLDFGLAKRLPEHGAHTLDSLTATGQGPAGTLTHMAPEVLQGRRADARTDVWALGVLLYELVTGTLPFAGRTPFETSSAILADAPKPLARRVPLALRLVITRCLEKDPSRRYQHARDVRDALRAIRNRHSWPVAARLLGTSRRAQQRFAVSALALIGAALTVAFAVRPAERPIHAIAVMPLEHAGTADDAAYAGGLTDAMAAQLGASAGVRVLSTGSARRAGRTPLEAGRALGADAVIVGALRRTAQGIELDLRLVDTATGATRWSRPFAGGPREGLVVQAEAVRALAARIDAAMTPAARERLTLVPAIGPDVYEAYLKGRYEWNQRTAASLQRAVGYFERAIALDPTYAPAHARLADCFNLLGTVMVGSGSPHAYRPRAEAAAIKALQIDPELAEAHAALGYVRHYSWQWEAAEQSFQRAIALNPSAPLPRLWYANLLMSKGRFDESLRQAFSARDLDPFSLVVHTNIGWIQSVAGRTADAIATLRHAVALDPSYPQATWRLAGALSEAGHHAEALAEVEKVLQLTNRSASSLALSAHVAATAGRAAEARRVLAELNDMATRGYVSPGIIPGAYVRLGDHDAAIQWLERAVRERANSAAYFAVELDLQPLRNDPRYQSLLRRVGLADVRAP